MEILNQLGSLTGPAMFAALAALALLDSTSIGTLLIPVWLLLAPTGVRVHRMLIYLGTISAFYFAVGLTLALGADATLTWVGVGSWGESLLVSPAASWAQLGVGAVLLIASFRMGPGGNPDTDGPRPNVPGSGGNVRESRWSTPGRILRWRDRVVSAEAGSGSGALMALALTAAAIEVASMLPYLAAIGVITHSGVGWPASAAILAGYCALMIAPAALLTSLRVTARRWIDPMLRTLSRWLARTASETTSWIVGIVGFFVARDAATKLQLFDWLS